MPPAPQQQLHAIHTMLRAGQRNLRVERHTLLLWGLVFGILVLASSHILTAEQIPDNTQRALAWLALLSITLALVGLADWHLTRRAKQSRDETWSFVHRQILKVWWLLMSGGILMSFATFFYGGGYLLLPIWLVLAGLGLYVHGLFSEECLEWTGVMVMAIGVFSAGFHLDYPSQQRVCASTLGLGLPTLAWMIDRGRERSALLRLGQSLLWLLVVLAPPLWVARGTQAHEPAPAPQTTLEQFQAHPGGRQAVTLPAGTIVAVRVDVSGDTFRPSARSVLPLVLDHSVELIVEDGQPTGDWRPSGGPWLHAGADRWIAIPRILPQLNPQTGPEVEAALAVNTLPGASLFTH